MFAELPATNVLNGWQNGPPRFNTCYILGLLSYLAGCFTDPGGIPDAWWRVRNESPCDSHTMHGTGIFTYIWCFFLVVNVGIWIYHMWMPWDCLFWIKKWVMWGSLFFEKGHSVEKKSKQTRLELVSTFLWTKKYDAVVSSFLIHCWKAFLTCKDGGIWSRWRFRVMHCLILLLLRSTSCNQLIFG